MIRWLNVKQPEPERYFQSDFLERFTHMKLSTIWLIWGPISLLSIFASFYFGGKAATESSIGFFGTVLVVLLLIALGFVRWTLIEYFLHRFPFHYNGPSQIRRKVAWYAHGIHHRQAMLKTRLVAPPLVSVAVGGLIALLDWFFMGLLFGAGSFGFALYAGTALGYLFYDTMHWCIHIIDADWAWYRKLRRHHMRHHNFSQGRFGVSSTLWDHVFRTYPKSDEEELAKAKRAAQETQEESTESTEQVEPAEPAEQMEPVAEEQAES